MTTRNNRNNRNQAAPPRTLEVITTHLNADFDAMASMVAAKKLYPEALLVFPGSQERNLRDFFIRSSFYFVDFTRMKQVPLEEIKRLILVDTRQASRIGKFAEVAASGEVDIHIYDHHPDTDEDVHGSVEVVEEIGSTTAILTRILRERGLTLSPRRPPSWPWGFLRIRVPSPLLPPRPRILKPAPFSSARGPTSTWSPRSSPGS